MAPVVFMQLKGSFGRSLVASSPGVPCTPLNHPKGQGCWHVVCGAIERCDAMPAVCVRSKSWRALGRGNAAHCTDAAVLSTTISATKRYILRERGVIRTICKFYAHWFRGWHVRDISLRHLSLAAAGGVSGRGEK